MFYDYITKSLKPLATKPNLSKQQLSDFLSRQKSFEARKKEKIDKNKKRKE